MFKVNVHLAGLRQTPILFGAMVGVLFLKEPFTVGGVFS
jgi:hypothetical protein